MCQEPHSQGFVNPPSGKNYHMGWVKIYVLMVALEYDVGWSKVTV